MDSWLMAQLPEQRLECLEPLERLDPTALPQARPTIPPPGRPPQLPQPQRTPLPQDRPPLLLPNRLTRQHEIAILMQDLATPRAPKLWRTLYAAKREEKSGVLCVCVRPSIYIST